MSDLHRRGLAQRAHQRALSEFDLECVVLARLWPWRKRRRPPLSTSLSSSGLAAAALLPPRVARHGTVATPPSAMRASRDRAVVEIERDRGRRQRELVGFAVADLQIERAAGPTASPGC